MHVVSRPSDNSRAPAESQERRTTIVEDPMGITFCVLLYAIIYVHEIPASNLGARDGMNF